MNFDGTWIDNLIDIVFCFLKGFCLLLFIVGVVIVIVILALWWPLLLGTLIVIILSYALGLLI